MNAVIQAYGYRLGIQASATPKVQATATGTQASATPKIQATATLKIQGTVTPTQASATPKRPRRSGHGDPGDTGYDDSDTGFGDPEDQATATLEIQGTMTPTQASATPKIKASATPDVAMYPTGVLQD